VSCYAQCWVTGESIGLRRQATKITHATPHLAQNLKALGSWVTSHINLYPHPYLINVGLQLYTWIFQQSSLQAWVSSTLSCSPAAEDLCPLHCCCFRSTGLALSLIARKISTQGVVTALIPLVEWLGSQWHNWVRSETHRPRRQAAKKTWHHILPKTLRH
jgi:hypothetical protein